jgi:hypothetical protein
MAEGTRVVAMLGAAAHQRALKLIGAKGAGA